MTNLDSTYRLTILIPSYERQPFLVRQIEYWRDKNEFKVVILDGSRFELKLNGKLPTNISYWHLPETIEDRLLFGANHIQTKYAALLSDDEFYFPSGLNACMDKLEKYPEIVSCKGVAIGFDFIGGCMTGHDVYPEIRESASLCQEFPRERMLAHLNPYRMITLWSVMRSELMLSTLRAIATGPYGSAAAGEIQTSLLAAFNGKCCVVNNLMWMRSYENHNIWWESGNQSFVDWYIDKANDSEIKRFIDSIMNEIPIGQRAAANSWLHEALHGYTMFCGIGAQNTQLPGAKKKLFSLAKRLVKTVLELMGFIDYRYKKSLNLVINRLEKQGIQINKNEVGDVLRRVSLHHHRIAK